MSEMTNKEFAKFVAVLVGAIALAIAVGLNCLCYGNTAWHQVRYAEMLASRCVTHDTGSDIDYTEGLRDPDDIYQIFCKKMEGYKTVNFDDIVLTYYACAWED